ncbi:MAG: hypothetical protein GY809_25860, partial [Planctomycetes bacterium]|nr:hypothetical protein [Planctomycetota bacterium]
MKRMITLLAGALCLWMSWSVGAQIFLAKGYTELVRSNDEFSSALLVPARAGDQTGVALLFEGSDDLHYYA